MTVRREDIELIVRATTSKNFEEKFFWMEPVGKVLPVSFVMRNNKSMVSLSNHNLYGAFPIQESSRRSCIMKDSLI